MNEITLTLEKQSDKPMYDQLVQYIIGEIRAGRLGVGERLPSKRALCPHLGISLSTAESAYAILVAEGYVAARARSGYYVCPYEPPVRAQEAPPAPRAADDAAGDLLLDFSTGAVDTSLFPYASWAKLNKEVVRGGAALLERGHPQGDLCLREALCAFLHQYRGVSCTPDQVVIGCGMEYLLRALIDLMPGAVFALEDPGYRAAYRAMENAGRDYRAIPLDSAGMRVDALRDSGAQVAYVTASHQFPTGVTMPAGRRAQLLNWAGEKPDRYLIEDDYDSEFRHLTRPIPAMQGVDQNGRVIYVGTFSRSIAPSIRVAYLVLPHGLIGRWRRAFDGASCTVSRFEQHTLCRFIAEGFYARHLRRMASLYAGRRRRLLELLQEVPGARVSGAEAGLHFLLTMEGWDEKNLIERARERGVLVRGLSQYGHGQRAEQAALVLGYAGMTEDMMVDACARLKAAWV